MKKQNKVLWGVLAAVVLVGVALYAGNSAMFQGRLSRNISKASRCNVRLENFDPNSGTVAKYGDAVDFKWNGPGCSQYDFTQYLLCFENVANSQEHACVGVVPTSNHWTLSGEDWRFINGEMKTLTSRSQVDTYWYVQSRFGNALNGETFNAKPWKFSYTK